MQQRHATAKHLKRRIYAVTLEIVECWGLFGEVRVRVLSRHQTLVEAGEAMNKLPELPLPPKKKEHSHIVTPYARIRYYDGGRFPDGKLIHFICAYHNLLPVA